MGYRSDVAIAVKEEYAKEFTKLVEKLEEPDRKQLTKDGVIKAVFYESCTWSEMDEDIEAISSFVKNLDPEEYGMIVIGENIDDIEYFGNPYNFDIALKRSIVFYADFNGEV